VYLYSIPVAVIQQGVFYTVHTDQLDTPRAISDPQGVTVWRWEGEPFGVTLADEDPDGDGVKFVFNGRFSGQYYDDETGLYYNYHRYYDPATGRYITSDPIGLAGGLNTYIYVTENPLAFVDRVGLKVDTNGIVLLNKKVVNQLELLNSKLIELGYDDNCFTILVTGGDRYRDINGVIRSASNYSVVKNSVETSRHLYENGASAVDFVVLSNLCKCGEKEFDSSDLITALHRTSFENILDNYPDNPHIHVRLPKSDEWSMWYGWGNI